MVGLPKGNGIELILKIRFRFEKGNRALDNNNVDGLLEYKWITFQMSSCPGQCPIVHFLGLAFADDAFKAVRQPRQLGLLHVPKGKHSLPLEWKESMLNIPIFRHCQQDGTIAPSRAMMYDDLASQISDLGYRAKFRDVLRTYCLRRGVANVIDGKILFLAI